MFNPRAQDVHLKVEEDGVLSKFFKYVFNGCTKFDQNTTAGKIHGEILILCVFNLFFFFFFFFTSIIPGKGEKEINQSAYNQDIQFIIMDKKINGQVFTYTFLKIAARSTVKYY